MKVNLWINDIQDEDDRITLEAYHDDIELYHLVEYLRKKKEGTIKFKHTVVGGGCSDEILTLEVIE